MNDGLIICIFYDTCCSGASPIVTDYGRGLRAEQWARFCGRHSCAEIIEKCARASSTHDKDKDSMKYNGSNGKDKSAKGRVRANSIVPTTSRHPPLGINNNENIAGNNNQCSGGECAFLLI